MKNQHIQLTATDRDYLETLISKGELKARSYRRALGLQWATQRPCKLAFAVIGG